VPNLVNPSVRTNQATQAWRNRGFSANSLLFDPSVPPHYQIQRQSLPADTFVPCSSTMTVYQTP
jgi:hypothetical protein